MHTSGWWLRAFVLALGVGSGGIATAALVLPGSGYPAPGGNTSSSVGSNIQAGGRTITYGTFNTAAYSSLYYVVGDYPSGTFSSIGPRLWADGTSDQLSYNAGLSDLGAGKLVWSGTTNVPLVSGGSPSVGTRFTLQVTDFLGSALSLVSATSLGLSSSLGGALAVPNAGFKANWLFEIANPSSGTYGAAGSTYDAILLKNNAFNLASSVGGGFYYEPPTPVPLPATLPLLMGGIALFGACARRRASSQRAVQSSQELAS